MIYHEDVFAVFVEAVILQEGGRESSPPLCQGLLFVVLALVDVPSTEKNII